MELIGEILIEIYLELMMLVVPETNTSKRAIVLAKVLAIGVIFLAAGLLIGGVFLLTERKTLWGILPIAVAAVISLVQIVLGLWLYKKHHDEKERA